MQFAIRFFTVATLLICLLSCSKSDDSNNQNNQPQDTIANITIKDQNGEICLGTLRVYIFTSESWANHQNEIDFADQIAEVTGGTSPIVLDIPGLFSMHEQELLRFMSYYTVNGDPRYHWIALSFTEGSQRSGEIVLNLDFTEFSSCT